MSMTTVSSRFKSWYAIKFYVVEGNRNYRSQIPPDGREVFFRVSAEKLFLYVNRFSIKVCSNKSNICHIHHCLWAQILIHICVFDIAFWPYPSQVRTIWWRKKTNNFLSQSLVWWWTFSVTLLRSRNRQILVSFIIVSQSFVADTLSCSAMCNFYDSYYIFFLVRHVSWFHFFSNIIFMIWIVC